jgi:peptidyl-prolyl cis-trans isomerase SurA
MICIVFCLWTAFADGVAAFVGSEVILESEVQENIAFVLSNPVAMQMFEDTSEVRKYVLDELISQKLILNEAEQESVEVSDQEIKLLVDQNIEKIKERYPSEVEFLQDLERNNITLAELEEYNSKAIRAQLIMSRFVDKKIDTKTMVSPIAVQEFYEEHKDSIAIRPARVKLAHILMYIRPTEAAQKRGFERAIDVYKLLLAGGDFGVLAAEFSDDLSSKKKGGMLGKIHKGESLEEFEAVVFSLKPGKVSQPFPSRVGFHIVEVLNRGVDWVLARQILIRVPVSKSDTLRYEELAEQLRVLISNGSDFDSLAGIYSDDPNVDAGEWYVDQLAPPYNEVVKDLEEGELSEPVRTPLGFHLLYIREKFPEEVMPFEDLRDQIYDYLMQQEMKRYTEQLVSELREEIYVKTFSVQ